MSKGVGNLFAPAHRTPAIMSATASLSLRYINIHTGIEVVAYDPNDDLLLFQRQLDHFSAAMGTPDEKYLIRYKTQDVLRNDTFCVVALDDGQVIGSAYAHWTGVELWTKGVVVTSKGYRRNGIGSALSAATVAFGNLTFPGCSNLKCAYRIQPCGEENIGSRRAFQRLGYRANGQTGATRFSGTYKDRHLLPYLEEDEGGLFFRFRLMTATKSTPEKCIKYLSEWRHRVLPIAQN